MKSENKNSRLFLALVRDWGKKCSYYDSCFIIFIKLFPNLRKGKQCRL